MNPIDDQAQQPLGNGNGQAPVAPPNDMATPQLPPIGGLPAVNPAAQPTPSVPMPNGASAAIIPGLEQPTVPTAPTTKQSQYSPGIAEDVDLIEKEWVLKAKAIVKNTQGDPSLQNSEMSRYKADYLKTRYSKDLKVSDQ